jgi:hypothetical protein
MLTITYADLRRFIQTHDSSKFKRWFVFDYENGTVFIWEDRGDAESPERTYWMFKEYFPYYDSDGRYVGWGDVLEMTETKNPVEPDFSKCSVCVSKKDRVVLVGPW